MAKAKFIFEHADGRKATRCSERNYTHVVVCCENIAAQRAG